MAKIKPSEKVEWERELDEAFCATRDKEKIRAAVQMALDEREPEPGQPIARGTCPCCGACLRVEHGDDDGEIVFLAAAEKRASGATQEDGA